MLASKIVSTGTGAASQSQNTIRVTRLNDSKLLGETRFCQSADYNARTFGNYLYAIDGNQSYLHVFSVKDRKWNYSSLTDLGI